MKVTKGRVKKPIAMLLYAGPGVGKSTFGTECDSPVFIGSEENDEIDSPRLPKIKTWKDLTDQLDWLKNTKHDYKTLVVDTMDELENIAADLIISTEKGKTMATARGGFGKAYDEMERMFLDIRERLTVLREDKGMNIIILCHEEKTKHEDPITLTSYDTYCTALHKRIKPYFHDWVSIIAFAKDKFMRVDDSNGKKTVIGDGDKVIYFQDRPSHTAKNRFNLPEEMEFPISGTWNFIKDSVDEFFKAAPAPEKTATPAQDKPAETKPVDDNKFNLDHDLVSEIKETIAKIKNEDIRPKIQVSLARASNNDELKRILEKAKTLL